MRYFLLSFLPALLLVQGCGTKASSAHDAIADAVPATVMELQPTTRSATVHAAGLFSTDDETVLSFKTGGLVRSVLVKAGDAIKAGQVLATLDMAQIDAQVQQAMLAEDKAARDLQRAEALHRDSVVSLEQLQNARTGRDLAQQQLNAVQFDRRHAEIRAATDGFVLQKFAEPGQLVGPGTPVLQVNGAGSKGWVLKAGISDKDWALVHTGDSAVVTADAWPGRSWPAVVSSRSMGADPRSGSFLVELRIAGTAGDGLASGLYGKATITTRAEQHAFAIPHEALLDGDGDRGIVFLAGPDGKAHRAPVTVVGFTNDHVLITGPATGDRLVVSGGAYLTEGATLSIAH